LLVLDFSLFASLYLMTQVVPLWPTALVTGNADKEHACAMRVMVALIAVLTPQTAQTTALATAPVSMELAFAMLDSLGRIAMWW